MAGSKGSPFQTSALTRTPIKGDREPTRALERAGGRPGSSVRLERDMERLPGSKGIHGVCGMTPGVSWVWEVGWGLGAE